MLIHNKYVKWRQELGQDFCEGILDFGKMHLDIYKVTNVPKYRSFQYRILQRGLVTNIQLCKWGIVPSENCSFCHEEKESVSHLFYECAQIHNLWSSLVRYSQENFKDCVIEINVRNVMLNKVHVRANHIANFLCLLLKYYIYSRKCLGRPLIEYEMIGLFKRVERIEKYIAIKNGSLSTHNKKWGKDHEDICTQNFIAQYVVDM